MIVICICLVIFVPAVKIAISILILNFYNLRVYLKSLMGKEVSTLTGYFKHKNWPNGTIFALIYIAFT